MAKIKRTVGRFFKKLSIRRKYKDTLKIPSTIAFICRIKMICRLNISDHYTDSYKILHYKFFTKLR